MNFSKNKGHLKGQKLSKTMENSRDILVFEIALSLIKLSACTYLPVFVFAKAKQNGRMGK